MYIMYKYHLITNSSHSFDMEVNPTMFANITVTSLRPESNEGLFSLKDSSSHKKKGFSRCQENLKGWMSYNINYKVLCLYYKTNMSGFGSLKTDDLVLKHTNFIVS